MLATARTSYDAGEANLPLQVYNFLPFVEERNE